MTTLEYTHEFDSTSTLVDGVYYNANDRTVTVDLNDDLYRYSDVPKSVFDAFSAAPSKGRFYSTEVKRKYGPGEYVGNYDDVEFKRVLGVPAPDMGAVGTPKGLTYAEGAKVFNLGGEPNVRFDLLPAPVEKAVTRKHAVTFTVEGGNTRKVYSVDTTDVASAVDALTEVADALGVTLGVKEVTVYFE